jgi:hypothetical protein
MLRFAVSGGFPPASKPPHRLKFSPEEDAQLAELVRIYGEEDWATISSLLPGRNARQCRERWRHYVSPAVSHAPFTAEEDALLLQKFAELGPKWKAIAVFFTARTDITLKNRLLLLARHCRRAEAVAPALPIPPPQAVPDPIEIPWSDEDDPRKTYTESTELGGDYFCLGFQCLH